MNIKNNINTYQTNTDYVNDMSKDFPNISYIQGTDEVKWNKYDPDHIVCIYNVTSTESATKLLGSNTNITYQIIDGVQQKSVQMDYTFDTLGEHIVKYKVNNNIINENMFYECRNNLTSVSIPNGVTTISQQGFYRCESLVDIIIPNTVTSIGAASFRVCTRLTNITIPSSVTSFNNRSFYNCSSLASVTVLATTPPTLGEAVFDGNASGRKIYVPAASVETYKETSGWSDYASYIQAIPSV